MMLGNKNAVANVAVKNLDVAMNATVARLVGADSLLGCVRNPRWIG
jgi:hypothetical protein